MDQEHHTNGAGNTTATSAAAAGAGGKSSGSSLQCRQSSSRWIPTSDQIRILKGLYYNSGLRSPTAEQIQRISARLRQYGKIEGKNVFYWFQNHKARERQKKRLTVEVPPSNSTASNFSLCPGVSPISAAIYGSSQHQLGSFMDCSFAAGVGVSNVMDSGAAWLGVDVSAMPTEYYYQHHQQQHGPMHRYPYYTGSQKKEEEEEAETRIETLPLFPIRAQEQQLQHYCLSDALEAQHQVGHLHCDASLELTLSSYFSPQP